MAKFKSFCNFFLVNIVCLGQIFATPHSLESKEPKSKSFCKSKNLTSKKRKKGKLPSSLSKNLKNCKADLKKSKVSLSNFPQEIKSFPKHVQKRTQKKNKKSEQKFNLGDFYQSSFKDILKFFLNSPSEEVFESPLKTSPTKKLSQEFSILSCRDRSKVVRILKILKDSGSNFDLESSCRPSERKDFKTIIEKTDFMNISGYQEMIPRAWSALHDMLKSQ
ncbi:hypothetical protein K737_300736 [Holospora undulata HU1]|uniref:Uncharacterized protein n=1 Tax=Holospora undulata HU1 TaxID=1321371 RepID=A0A061JHH3_9PROT|nr:hypothetical protein K737_300736 [Holospora undulata HU1]